MAFLNCLRTQQNYFLFSQKYIPFSKYTTSYPHYYQNNGGGSLTGESQVASFFLLAKKDIRCTKQILSTVDRLEKWCGQRMGCTLHKRTNKSFLIPSGYIYLNVPVGNKNWPALLIPGFQRTYSRRKHWKPSGA